MQNWSRYLIIDSSVTAVQGLRFGRAFMGFDDQGEALFCRKPENVKLYEKLEDCEKDFDKIPSQVTLLHFIIQASPPNVNISHGIIQKK